MVVKLKNYKGSYANEEFDNLVTQLRRADQRDLLDREVLCNVRGALDQCMLSHFRYAIEENMHNGAKFEFIRRTPQGWLDCEFSDNTIKYQVVISTDLNGNYYLLSADNILTVNNTGKETRFSITDIEYIQNQVKDIARKVFKAFNGEE